MKVQQINCFVNLLNRIAHLVYTLLLEKQYVSPGNTKLSWVVIKELRKKGIELTRISAALE